MGCNRQLYHSKIVSTAPSTNTVESISQVWQFLSACWCLLSTAVWPGGTRGGREMNLATNAPSLKRFTADTLNTTPTVTRTLQIDSWNSIFWTPANIAHVEYMNYVTLSLYFLLILSALHNNILLYFITLHNYYTSRFEMDTEWAWVVCVSCYNYT